MREIIIKAFGDFETVPEQDLEACLRELQALCQSWYLDDNVFGLERTAGKLGLHIYHEGEYFPHEEAAEILAKYIRAESQGKMDIIDYEAWTLRRYFLQMEYQRTDDLAKGIVYSRSSSLDHALEASMEKNSGIIVK